MGILQGASGTNDNTLIYIVNSLDGNVKKVSTLAENAGIIAQQAADGVEQVVVVITNLRSEFASEVELNAALMRIGFTESQIADLTDQYGEVVAENATLSQNISELQQTATSFTATFTQIQNDLTDAENGLTEVHSWIQETADGILLGKSDSSVKLRITNSAIQIIEDNQVITYWDNQAQQTPQALIIPEGGNFTIGHFRWVPRSSGNLSLVRVN